MRTALWILAAGLMLAPASYAGYGQDDPRLDKLYKTFIAPCCWRDNLAEHDSPAAEQLRGRIAGMVQDGESDDQIKQALVKEFGPRILVLPEGAQRQWLFWTPFAVGFVGFMAILLWLRRAREIPQPLAAGSVTLPPEVLRDFEDE